MRIARDENLPRTLKQTFSVSDFVATVQELGFAGISNGELLSQLEGKFDVFFTADKNLRYQQNLTGRLLAIIELPTNRLPMLTALMPVLVAAIKSIQPGQYRVIQSES